MAAKTPWATMTSRASGAAFSARVNQLSQRVFCISSNVANLQRLVGLLGTSKDTEALRGNLHDVTEDTRTLVRESSQDIRNLARLDNTHAKKLEHNKISKDFQKVLVEFQKVQRLSAEKQREFVDRVKHTSFGKAQDLPSVQDEPSQSSAQLSQWDSQRRMQLLMVDNELDFNEAMIGQREQEIQEIEHGITEINEVFKDLGSMVYEQSSLLDSIEYNVTPIAMNTRAAAEELTTAALRQRNARKRRALRSLLERHVGPFTKSQTELFARAKIYQLKQRTSVTKYIEFENLQAKIDATTEAEAILVIGPSQDIRHL
ncbi:hypothetical protein BGX31_002135 [Mortierella sp. GBA43]|nr:hypothetical protein BGX31_002135 [Mortierella sp. GBA43]